MNKYSKMSKIWQMETILKKKIENQRNVNEKKIESQNCRILCLLLFFHSSSERKSKFFRKLFHAHTCQTKIISTYSKSNPVFVILINSTIDRK